LVRVTFRDITESPPRVYGRGYLYRWGLSETPEVGQRLLVPGWDGPAWTVIIGIDDADPNEILGVELQDAIRLATGAEVAAGRAQYEREPGAWLDMMRHAAGLPMEQPAQLAAPAGFPDIPPADGIASAGQAAQYGSAWWRAYKNARTEEERRRFRSLAHRWYAIRDRQAKPRQPPS
jgi:hypothetical protein